MQLYTSNAAAARNVGHRDEKTILRELDQTFSSSIGNGARKVILSYMHPKVLPCLALPSFPTTVKLDFKELLIKEQIDFKELFTDYQLFYTMNLLLIKELLLI